MDFKLRNSSLYIYGVMHEITLRKSVEADLRIFFLNQTDEVANYMAAFTPENPHDEAAYMAKWFRLMEDETVHMQTILFNQEVIGCLVKFEMDGEAEITYAINSSYWNKGITSQAVEQFLTLEPMRPLYGRVAFDNYGSQRVLEKVGFKAIGTNYFFANARGKEIKELIYRLDT
ncbi:MAG: GNAT family N-acetyltransferase [Bacteroidota bacterium]